MTGPDRRRLRAVRSFRWDGEDVLAEATVPPAPRADGADAGRARRPATTSRADLSPTTQCCRRGRVAAPVARPSTPSTRSPATSGCERGGRRNPLNGEPFFVRAAQPGLLAADPSRPPSADALRQEVETALALGFNTMRIHQKPGGPRCCTRRLGLVWPRRQRPRTEQSRTAADGRMDGDHPPRPQPSERGRGPAHQSGCAGGRRRGGAADFPRSGLVTLTRVSPEPPGDSANEG